MKTLPSLAVGNKNVSFALKQFVLAYFSMICGEILQMYPAGSYLILLMSAQAICNVAARSW